MTVFILKLILAHLIGDFLLQPRSWIEDKLKNKARSKYLYVHVLIHGLLMLIFLEFDIQYWKIILFIVVSHWLIDLDKLHMQKRVNQGWLFILDQMAHLLVILGVAYAQFHHIPQFDDLFDSKLLLLITAILCLTRVTAIMIKMMMQQWALEDDQAEDSLKNAGQYIGMLERLLAFGFILLNQWQAIGLLIAAKSVFRFSDLSRAKDRKLTEYILIGTLLSLGMAMIIGYGYVYLYERLH